MDVRIATAAFTFAMVFAGSSVAASADHYYTYQDGDAYGYEKVNEAELFMIRYMGEKDGKHKFVMGNGKPATVYTCGIPCRYVKVKQYWGREAIDSTVLKAQEGSVVWAIYQDIAAGELEPLEDDQGRRLWSSSDKGPYWTKPDQ